jgi:hypothetical protein
MANIFETIDAFEGEGRITENEADYLKKVAATLLADLEDVPHEKIAAWGGAARNVLGGLSRERAASILQILGGVGLTAAYTAPMASRAVHKLVDPAIEAHRYRQMQRLEGAPLQVPRETLSKYFIPEDEDNREEAAIRKAFSILHRTAPEITRTPEIARVFLNEQMKGDPVYLAQQAQNFQKGVYGLESARQGISNTSSGQMASASKGLSEIGKGIEGLNRQDEEYLMEKALQDKMLHHRVNESFASQIPGPSQDDRLETLREDMYLNEVARGMAHRDATNHLANLPKKTP